MEPKTLVVDGAGIKVVRDSTLTFRINNRVKSSLEELAQAAGTSTADFVHKIVMDALKSQGVSIQATVTVI